MIGKCIAFVPAILVGVALGQAPDKGAVPLPISGLWFDPALDGEGYNVIQSASGTTIFYFGYSASGERLWLVSDTLGDPIVANQTVTLTMFVGGSGSFDAPAPSTELTEWGTLMVTIDNCGEGQFELDGADGDKVSQVMKLADISGLDDSVCPTPQAGPFVLTSASFDPGGTIQSRHTCTGADVAPSVSWSGAPNGTDSFALIMDDENPPCGAGDGACRHWGVFNIPPTVNGLAEGEDVTQIEGVTLGAAFNFAAAYAGPCPPRRHVYLFELYALRDTMPEIASGTPLSRHGFRSQFSGQIIESTVLRGVFP